MFIPDTETSFIPLLYIFYVLAIEIWAHPFLSQKYSPSHEHDGTPRCYSCEHIESWDTRCDALNDGRKLCLECLDSSVMDTNECQPFLHGIQDFFVFVKGSVRVPEGVLQTQYSQ